MIYQFDPRFHYSTNLFLSKVIFFWQSSVLNYFHNILRLFDVLPNFMIPQVSVFLRKRKFCQSWPKTFEKQKLNFTHSELFWVKTRVSLKYFVTDCLWKPGFDFNSPQTPSNLISLAVLVTPALQFLFKIKFCPGHLLCFILTFFLMLLEIS